MSDVGTSFTVPEATWLSPETAANRLGISTDRLYELVESGELPLMHHGMIQGIPADAVLWVGKLSDHRLGPSR